MAINLFVGTDIKYDKKEEVLKVLLPPQTLIFIVTILGILLIIVIVAKCFGRALNKKMSTLTFVTKKVEQQDLEFKISTSGIKEVDEILHSMDCMRNALKDSLEQQWKIEQEKTIKCPR